jgi:hypothetical protein
LGETFTYSVVLSHQSASTAPAYNIVVKDLLADPNLRLQAGSVVTSSGFVSAGNAPGDQNIKIDLARLLPGEVLSVSFKAKIETMPLPNGLVTNTATFGFVSTPDTTLPPTFIRSDSGRDSANVQVATPLLRPAEGSPLSGYSDAFRRVQAVSSDLPIVLAGTAEPGSAVGIEIRDASGAPFSVGGVTADAGRHWMAPPVSTNLVASQDLEALSALRTAAGRESAPVGDTRLSQPLPAAWLPSNASSPYTVSTTESSPGFMREASRGGVAVTFNGVVDPEGFVASDTRQSTVIERPSSSTWSTKQNMGMSGGLVWNSFARDFANSRQLGR